MPLLLGSATQTSPGVSLFAPASGGGGGGGGPDPSFSSITMDPQGFIFLNYNGGTGTAIGFNTDTTGSNYVNFTAFPCYSMAPNNVSSMTGIKPTLVNQNGVFDGLQCGGIIFDGNGQGSSATTPGMASDVTGSLNVWASNVNISSLTVSSINGAAPGGGGSGPNPSVSSLTVAVNGTIEFLNDNTWDAGGVAWDTDATGTSSIIFAPSYANDESGASSNICLGTILTVAAGSSYQNIGANTLFLNTGYGATPGAVIMNDPLAPGTAYVSSIRVSSINGAAPGGGVSPSGISTNQVSAVASTLTLSANSSSYITLDDTKNIAVELTARSGTGAISLNAWSTIVNFDLNVSSINGAAPGGGGSGPVFSTLFEATSTIICGVGSNTPLLTFPVVNGKGYNCSWQASVTGFNADPTNEGQNLVGLLTVNGGNTSIVANVPLAQISTNLSQGFDSIPLGGCLNFRGGTNSNVLLEVYNNTPSTVTVTLGETYLVLY